VSTVALPPPSAPAGSGASGLPGLSDCRWEIRPITLFISTNPPATTRRPPLSTSAVSAFCTVTYVPRSRGSGIDTLTVNYPGDDTHGSSSGSTRITIAGQPSAKITSPSGGRTYEVGQLVHTRFSCREGPGGPGIASCKDSNGATSPRGMLNTRRAGRHTYAVTATSRDGLTRRVSISYTVVARHRRRR
jgi:hypothetical protein